MKDRRSSNDAFNKKDLRRWLEEVRERKRLGLLNAIRTPSDQQVYPAENGPGIDGTKTIKKPRGRPSNKLGGKCIRGHVLTKSNTTPTPTGYRCLDCHRKR